MLQNVPAASDELMMHIREQLAWWDLQPSLRDKVLALAGLTLLALHVLSLRLEVHPGEVRVKRVIITIGSLGHPHCDTFVEMPIKGGIESIVAQVGACKRSDCRHHVGHIKQIR